MKASQATPKEDDPMLKYMTKQVASVIVGIFW